MKKVRKCKASHCFHESREILPDDNVVEVSNAIYHKDCYQAISNIKEVMDIFATKINRNVVFSELRKVINNIVFQRGIDSGMLLFGIKYYINHHIPLNYPQGLYYVVQNKDVQNGYKKEIVEKDINKHSFEVLDDKTEKFDHIKRTQQGFSDVLVGGSK